MLDPKLRNELPPRRPRQPRGSTRSEGQNCVLVTGMDDRLEGIFTERDVLQKVASAPETLAMRIEALMSAPDTLRPQSRIAAALRLMNEGHYRHVPVVDDDGRIV